MPAALILIPVLFLLLTGCLFDLNETVSKKSNSFSNIPISQLSYRGNVQRSIGLKFNTKISEVSEITAQVQLPDNYVEPIIFKWALGENITIQTGDLSGRIENYEKNKKINIKILIRGFNSDVTKHVRFEISSEKLQPRIFADGIVSNNKQNSFEQIVKEVEIYKKENSK